MQQETAINTAGNETFKSNWGYHPCSYETFRKIKKLRRYYYESLPKAAAYYRWARKAEKNRNGNEPGVPPVFCEVVSSNGHGCKFDSSNFHPKMGYNSSEKNIGKSCWIKCDKGEGFIYMIPMGYVPRLVESKWGNYTVQDPAGLNNEKTVIVRNLNIDAIYENARIPRESADDVVRLSITEEELDDMLNELQQFFGH
jgi:hypothetical protein